MILTYYSPIIFLLNIIGSKDIKYSFLFIGLFGSSLLYHRNRSSIFLFWLDQFFILVTTLYGSSILLYKKIDINVRLILLLLFMINFTFYFYGYMYNCFCHDYELGYFFHMILHYISSLGHLILSIY